MFKNHQFSSQGVSHLDGCPHRTRWATWAGGGDKTARRWKILSVIAPGTANWSFGQETTADQRELLARTWFPWSRLGCKTAKSAGCPPEEKPLGSTQARRKVWSKEYATWWWSQLCCQVPERWWGTRDNGEPEMGFQNAFSHPNWKIRTLSFCVTHWCWTDSITLSHLLFSAGILHHFLYSLDYI